MANRISKNDKIKYYDFIVAFEKNYSNKDYTWLDLNVQAMLQANGITDSVGSGTYWITLNVHRGKDKAYSFLKRLRNSMAHGNITKGRKYYYIDDVFPKTGNKTMECKIPIGFLWRFVNTILATQR